MQLQRLILGFALAAAAVPSMAVGRLVDVTILDRDTGAVLPQYRHRGEIWVAGHPGSRYAVVLRNRLGERVLAVTAIDGVNVLSGETAGWNQSGYVLSPSHRYQVTGWRKSQNEVAAFSFSSVEASYAARTGRSDQVGVIGVAVFREKAPEPLALWPQPTLRKDADNRSRLENDRGMGSPAAPSAFGDGLGKSDLADRAAERASSSNEAESAQDAGRAGTRGMALAQRAPAPRLGTAHGRSETSRVSHTTFERQHERPDDIIRIRYDSRENLIASGVIRLPAPRLDPFPASSLAEYVPDPPPLRH